MAIGSDAKRDRRAGFELVRKRVLGDEELSWQAIRRSWQAYALLAPIFALLIVFVYYPPVLGLLRAFYRWRPGFPAAYVGLQNFTRYFSNPRTPAELINMIKFLCFGLFVGVVVPFVMAELVFFVRSRGAKEVYRLLVVIPMLVPGIVVTLLWQKLYDPNLGPINQALKAIGLEMLARNWLGDPATALYAIMFVGFPWVAGIGTLIYLGGLGQTSETVYDACAIDGCTGIRRVILIDLPLVLGQVRLLSILAIINAITSFQSVLILTDGGPGFATMVPGMSMYNMAFKAQEFGYASAIGLLLFVFCMVGTLVIGRTIRPLDESGGR
ncbi:MAG: carbohydrate ABC transporter permease [Anaerolineae bacterium]